MTSILSLAAFCRRCVVLAAWLALCTGTATGSERPRAWIDDATGFAIGGYDPVDYFVLAKPYRPAENEGVELFWGGVSWRFRNEGNRDAFIRAPDIYLPRFAGYDPAKLARGHMAAGEPIHFDISHGQLYLFHDRDGLQQWREDGEPLLEAARAAWPALARDLGIDGSEPQAPLPLRRKPADNAGREAPAPPGKAGESR